ncbi:Dihydrolipoamide dehydrogenase of pyruvate dehydrogenase complex [Patulibacter medicamentivorans]|jgi:pyruvate/2-oxoglutarate dehydrogenase complex dihydrolipoamide acyltransferase (E2) component|uniref:Dihydrolipoamide dehydrogenase of pyruvate dehydrogenase complex n=1 Tax=Patulibacter medicamentivorans TaxID=1097667 RepID=H0E024_9ACTN|nr:biotin/lipoyl-containing protein [Patulibacter medicamentivorans]EHN12983.1 Dihydrolipoamide dehydrogenase of pyruvate dehydrogenase complex [Patulibacter medicamentivorans]
MEITVENGTADDEIEILEIAVEVGQEVAEGDLLVEVATDKANMEIVAPKAGRVAEIRVADGDDAPGNAVLLVLEDL